jgi:hypothetical protein
VPLFVNRPCSLTLFLLSNTKYIAPTSLLLLAFETPPKRTRECLALGVCGLLRKIAFTTRFAFAMLFPFAHKSPLKIPKVAFSQKSRFPKVASSHTKSRVWGISWTNLVDLIRCSARCSHPFGAVAQVVDRVVDNLWVSAQETNNKRPSRAVSVFQPTTALGIDPGDPPNRRMKEEA